MEGLTVWICACDPCATADEPEARAGQAELTPVEVPGAPRKRRHWIV